jgi:hypothetical protein
MKLIERVEHSPRRVIEESNYTHRDLELSEEDWQAWDRILKAFWPEGASGVVGLDVTLRVKYVYPDKSVGTTFGPMFHTERK